MFECRYVAGADGRGWYAQVSGNILSVMDDAIKHIVEYLSPCDAFSLSLTNKRIYNITPSIMKKSLESGLSRVLQHMNVPGLTLPEFSKFSKSCSPSAVAISGGCLLKAITAQEWKSSDIDIYTTIEEVPKVRSWLVKHCCQVLVSYSKFYAYYPGRPSSILIVEKYRTMPVDNTEFGDASHEDHWIFDKNKIYTKGIPVLFEDDEGDSIYYIKTTEEGFTLPFEPRLSYNKNCSCSVIIDLIIARPGRSVTDMINEFDLSIVQNLYDGESFRVCYPSKTFAKISSMQFIPDEFQFMKAYMNNLNEVCRLHRQARIVKNNGQTFTYNLDVLSLFSTVHDSGEPCVLEPISDNGTVAVHDQIHLHLNLVHSLRAIVIQHVVSTIIQTYENNELVHLDPFHTHNHIILRLNRLIKYSMRTIFIENAPCFISDTARILPETYYELILTNETDYEREEWLIYSFFCRLIQNHPN